MSLLSFIGINWPTVNEDRVREFASHVREFADSGDAAHRDSSSTVQQLGEAYQGASYETLAAKWAQVSDPHMNELVQACHVVATALDAAADVIVAMKLETITELVLMAAALVALRRMHTVTQQTTRLRFRAALFGLGDLWESDPEQLGAEVAAGLLAFGVGAGLSGLGRHRPAGQGRVRGRGEQPQGVPGVLPGAAGRGGGVEDREVELRAAQVVAGGEAGLAAADHQDVDGGGVRVQRFLLRKRGAAAPFPLGSLRRPVAATCGRCGA